tara:strand:+ start:23537 stop:24664 length:1128 start_codon:yes stop_codon:yes gene_type:complete
MKEQDFRKLLDKYLDGSISDREKELLNSFEGELLSSNDNAHFINESNKRRTRRAMWQKVQLKTIPNARLIGNWRIISSAAAVVIGLLVVGYIYIRNNGDFNYTTIPQDAITLELEDGTVKIIEENGSITVNGRNGRVLGQQHGNEIVYSNTENESELMYNTLTVPYGKTFELSLSDGTKAHLNAGSSLKYPITFLQGHERNIYVRGEAFLDVAKDSLRPFIVNCENMNVRVLGTKFNISAYPEDETYDVVLIEGAVSLYEAEGKYDSKNVVLLKPGFKGSFNKKSKMISKDSVLTDLYTAWMTGELIVRKMAFANIIQKLERHYNVTIVNQNEELAAKKFNANFGNEPIESVLEEFKINYGIDYYIDGNGDFILK